MLFSAWNAAGLEPLSVGADGPIDSFLDHVEVLEDPGAELGIDDVRSQDWERGFVASTTSALSFGYSSSSYWLRFSLQNPSPEAVEVLLDVGYPQLDEVVLYSPTETGYESLHMGDSLPYSQRPLALRGFVAPIRVPAGLTRTYYMRVASGSVVTIPLRLSTPHAYIERLQDNALVLGAFYGILLALLVYSFFLFVSSRELTYFYYAALSACYACYFAQLDGFGYRLWSTPGFWQSYSVFGFVWLGGLCLIQFGRQFLDLRSAMPRIDGFLRALLGLIAVSPFAAPFVALHTFGIYVTLLSGAALILPAVAYVRMRDGFEPARFYLVAWTPFWLALGLSSVAALGLLPSFLGVVAGLKLTVVGERLLMSFALANRLRLLQTDKLKAHAEALKASEERWRLEQSLREREAQLAQAQKLEAVGRLAGGVAHDFNNLLMVIQGNAEMLVERATIDDEGHEMAKEVLAGTGQAAALTRQLLALSRPATGRAELLDLNQAICGIKSMLDRVIGENIEFVAQLDPCIGRVEADSGELEQIVLNLALNGRDAIAGSGRITVTTGEVLIPNDVAEGEREEAGRYVRLNVSDTGSGMNENAKAHLFEPFFTTKEVGKGTGLGLVKVYGIVKRRGGRIRVDSSPESGTEIEILLPRHDVPEECAAAATKAGLACVPATETILLVEDEPSVLALMCGRLESLGYTVLAANDAETALGIADKHADSISLLVTDVVMPGMSGPELSERIRGAHPHIRALFISGYPQLPGERASRVPAGAAYLQKPVPVADLASKIREVLQDD